MKTLQAFFDEIAASEELKKQFTEAAKNDTIAEFAKANGVDATADEIVAFIEGKQDKELSADELEGAAGGGFFDEIREMLVHRASPIKKF